MKKTKGRRGGSPLLLHSIRWCKNRQKIVRRTPTTITTRRCSDHHSWILQIPGAEFALRALLEARIKDKVLSPFPWVPGARCSDQAHELERMGAVANTAVSLKISSPRMRLTCREVRLFKLKDLDVIVGGVLLCSCPLTPKMMSIPFSWEKRRKACMSTVCVGVHSQRVRW